MTLLNLFLKWFHKEKKTNKKETERRLNESLLSHAYFILFNILYYFIKARYEPSNYFKTKCVKKLSISITPPRNTCQAIFLCVIVIILLFLLIIYYFKTFFFHLLDIIIVYCLEMISNVNTWLTRYKWTSNKIAFIT